MRERTIKDPTFNIYKKGGAVEDKQQTLFDLQETDKANNIERRGKELKKDDLIKLAKDEADLKFDFESGISDVIIRDYYRERKPGQSITDWLDTKPRSYFLNIPLELAEGGKVIDFLSYLKRKEKPKIKRINLDSVAPGKAVVDLTDAEREVVNKLLRMSFNIKGD